MTKHNFIKFRRFVLYRAEDECGVSGTGIIAEGVQFSTKKSVISWISETPSIEVYDSIEEIRWIDDKN